VIVAPPAVAWKAKLSVLPTTSRRRIAMVRMEGKEGDTYRGRMKTVEKLWFTSRGSSHETERGAVRMMPGPVVAFPLT
jgi:hypothetical protein